MGLRVWSLWLFIEWAQWINSAQSRSAVHSTKESLYSAIRNNLNKTAANCTKYISPNWTQWMRENEIDYKLREEILFGSEYLLACLHDQLTNVNETSPFSLIENATLTYDIALTEVVSLGFDGTLVTKALLKLTLFMQIGIL